jgi:hypothetical protein
MRLRLRFAWANHDSFLQPEAIDGFNRGPADHDGNVVGARLQIAPEGQTATQPMPPL